MKLTCWILIVVVAFDSLTASAAQVDSPAPPTSPLSAMFSLEDIYNRLNAGTPGALRTGGFTNPTTGPVATRHTLNDVMAKAPASDNTNGATASQVLTSKTYWSLQGSTWGTGTGTMPNNSAVTITPRTTAQTIAVGYHNGSGTVSGDTNLVTGNIRAGSTIFGVAGKTSVVDTATGTAAVEDIAGGKTAYVNGTQITGTANFPSATGNAVVADVVVGKTFSNSTTSDLTGTRPVAPAARTGQTISYAAGDDGANQKGVVTPNPRFTDNGDGTVTDNLTSLIWLKNASAFGQQTWAAALLTCNNLAAGTAGLSDGSTAGQWRLPNVKELQSLIDFSNVNPALPTGYATYFTGAKGSYYWSSTTAAGGSPGAWYVNPDYGAVNVLAVSYNFYVWPVRGGQ